MEGRDLHTETVYVPLRNEGTNVLRPTQEIPLADGSYCLLPTADYDPEVEEWEFAPGSNVNCQYERRNHEKILVACRMQKDAPKSKVN